MKNELASRTKFRSKRQRSPCQPDPSIPLAAVCHFWAEREIAILVMTVIIVMSNNSSNRNTSGSRHISSKNSNKVILVVI